MKKIFFGLGALLLTGFVLWYFSSSDYYEYEASSQAECLPGEEFDSEAGACFFDFYCETDEECNLVDEKYGQVLDALAEEYRNEDRTYHESHSSNNPKATDDDLNIGNKEVVGGVDSAEQTQEIKKILEALLPENRLSQIGKIVADSDGEDGVLAYVEPMDEKGDKWKMAYDPADSFSTDGKMKNQKELLTTIVHEYAHIAMLNSEQVTHVGTDDEYVVCEEDEVTIDEGCAKASAHLTQFVEKFWDEDLRLEAFEAAQTQSEDEFSQDNFDKNQQRYVTEYAATNAVEDAAESFTFFIMKSRNENSTIADQKISFYYQFPEFVELRNYMRAGLLKNVTIKN